MWVTVWGCVVCDAVNGDRDGSDGVDVGVCGGGPDCGEKVGANGLDIGAY